MNGQPCTNEDRSEWREEVNSNTTYMELKQKMINDRDEARVVQVTNVEKVGKECSCEESKSESHKMGEKHEWYVGGFTAG